MYSRLAFVGLVASLAARPAAVLAALTLLVPVSCGGAPDSAQQLERAKAAVTTQDYEAAEIHARAVLDVDPASRDAEVIATYTVYGDQMLHAAFWEEDAFALEFLADIIYDIDAPDVRFGAPVLVLAAAWGRTQAVVTLLGAGADPNAGTDKDGHTALMWAAKNFDEQIAMTSALLEKGADVHARSVRDETALQIAREYRNPNVVALLEEHGATE